MSQFLRIFVEKKPGFNIEANDLLLDFNETLGTQIKLIRLIHIYDISELSDEQKEDAARSVLAEINVDSISYDNLPCPDKNGFAVEFIPGQFDQRADSAGQCLKLVISGWDGEIKSGSFLSIEGNISNRDRERVKSYFINPVESREKDLSFKGFEEHPEAEAGVPRIEGFLNMNKEAVSTLHKNLSLAMSTADLAFIRDYFIKENREPTLTEIKVLDTYWSDHCRHTTFETEIESIDTTSAITNNGYKELMDKTILLYHSMRKEAGREGKPITFMDLATIYPRFLRATGKLEDLDVSDEINACSVKVKVDVNGKPEDWLLMFKNETHNHPTEIEPFGGASTCIGGAIRDPLSGRSYVYQALRITGASDPRESLKDTLEGKLPQKTITQKAALGYSSYGNQIGLATSYVREIYHPGYKAKRMEVGGVVGAVKEDWVRREKPLKGDVIILLGGKTGRDGCGGATGSSKKHTSESIETCGAEVQKGNAPEERKIQRLFRNKAVTKLIKKCNDFGAGGVSVAIGELADSLDIELDKIPLKYAGLTGTEIAISESQERMAVVVTSVDAKTLISLAHAENLEATIVAKVTDSGRLMMFWKGDAIVDISREFLDTNGVRLTTSVKIVGITPIEEAQPFKREIEGDTLKEKFINNLAQLNVCSQKGLNEMFDSSVGAGTVILPFGGKYRLSPSECSIHKFPIPGGETDTVSLMAHGFNPEILEWSPFHGAAYAVVESITRLAASGGRWKETRMSFQEYFRRMESAADRGILFSALSGALWIQEQFGLPSIGGKDSMSGTFHDLRVPNTLISFAVTTGSNKSIISTDLKESGNNIYLIKHTPLGNGLPDIQDLIENFSVLEECMEKGNILSSSSVKEGGLAETLVAMGIGNNIGIKIEKEISEEELFARSYGSIVIETPETILADNAILLGRTIENPVIKINKDLTITLKEAIASLEKPLSKIFHLQEPATAISSLPTPETGHFTPSSVSIRTASPRVILPVFPGMNSEYDSADRFAMAGAKPILSVFRNRTDDDIKESLEQLAHEIDNSQILMLSGGFSAGDEPDGSGKFIANVLRNQQIAKATESLINRGGLILGICNGFQALLKSGLLPYGKIGLQEEDSPTLARNNINRHVARLVTTKVINADSPWLSLLKEGDTHEIAVSHGEGRFYASNDQVNQLFADGQVAFQYVYGNDQPSPEANFNPNGSVMAIEGITSPDGRILGKMGHSERYRKGCYINSYLEKEQKIFESAVEYLKGSNS